MATVTRSPKRQLEALFGHRPAASRPNAGTWMGLSLGNTVREKDGRHTGRVERIEWSRDVLVRWHETGWLSLVPLTELQKEPDK